MLVIRTLLEVFRASLADDRREARRHLTKG